MGLRAFFRKAAPAPAVAAPDPSPAAVAVGSSGWARAGMRFDVHSMSKDELREMAHQLLAGGAISMPDLRLLALEPVTCSADWPGWDRFETSGDADARLDWMAELAARIRRGHPDRTYIGYLESLRSFLVRVEAARPIDAAARPIDAAARPRPVAQDASATWPSRPRLASGRLTSPLPRPAST